MRKAVKWFANEMERKLSLHDDDKGSDGWLDEPVDYFIKQIKIRCKRIAKCHGDGTSNAVDIANFAMMIADNCKEDNHDKG